VPTKTGILNVFDVPNILEPPLSIQGSSKKSSRLVRGYRPHDRHVHFARNARRLTKCCCCGSHPSAVAPTTDVGGGKHFRRRPPKAWLCFFSPPRTLLFWALSTCSCIRRAGARSVGRSWELFIAAEVAAARPQLPSIIGCRPIGCLPARRAARAASRCRTCEHYTGAASADGRVG